MLKKGNHCYGKKLFLKIYGGYNEFHMGNGNKLLVFSGNSNPELAKKIADSLGTHLGDIDIRRFSDGEIFAEIKESVRGCDVFVIQSTCPPVNENLMELLVVVDALKRASVGNITAIIPYYGYARQDRKVAPRTPITAKLVADLYSIAGIGRLVSMDLHSGQIQGFFNIPFDNLFARPVLLDKIREQLQSRGDMVIVSPDAGGMERARAYAKKLDSFVAMIDKRRSGPNVAKAMNLVGDVQDKYALILDDMVDTAGTLTEAAVTIMEEGAKEVWAACVHPVLSGPAIERIEKSPITKLITTDTVPLNEKAAKCSKIEVVSTGHLFGQAITRIHDYGSISNLFD